MRIHVLSDSAPALLVGALLSVAGHEVSTEPEVPALRLSLPGARLAVRLSGPPSALDDVLVLHGDAGPEGASGRLVRICSGAGGAWDDGGGPPECAALFDVLADVGYLELLDAPATLVVARDWGLPRLLAPLTRRGFRIEEVRGIAGHRWSLLIARLVDLPAALCNTTPELFLSFPEGRRIAEAVLEEGLRVAEKVGPPLSRLSWRDPRELLRELRRRPSAFEGGRYAPGRRLPPVLQALLEGRQPEPHVSQHGLLRKAGEAGMAVDWNWRLLSLLPRVARAGFLRAPGELLRAVA